MLRLAPIFSLQSEDAEVSALGAVMAFLYSTYIIFFAVAGSLLGQYVDKVFQEDKNITRALTNIGGVQFTCVHFTSLKRNAPFPRVLVWILTLSCCVVSTVSSPPLSWRLASSPRGLSR